VASLVLQTAIGLTFVFAVFAGAVSAVSEAVARYFGLRGEYLVRGVRTAVDGRSDFKLPFGELLPWGIGERFVKRRASKLKAESGQGNTDDDEVLVSLIMSHPLVASSAHQASPPHQAGARPMSNAERRSLPSYLSGNTFAKVLVDVLVVDVNGNADSRETDGRETRNRDNHHHDPIRDPDVDGARQLTGLRRWAGSATPKHQHVARALRPLLAVAHDMKDLEASIADWYEDQMARVSGWYKRHVKWISLAIGLVLVVAFNVNAIKIADDLYSNQALTSSVVTEATRKSSCSSTTPDKCLAELNSEIGKLHGFGLDIGWSTRAACLGQAKCSWLDRRGLASATQNGSADVWTFLLVLLGWAVMILALLPGARFWFDLLSRLGSLRSTGPKPST
jgi:hypothetical protein